jgi:hypothetical protein
MKIISVAAVISLGLVVAACGGAPAIHKAGPPKPAVIANWLGCSLAPYADVSQQDAYDTVAYDSLIQPGDPSSPCELGLNPAGNMVIASDVITFSSRAKETDWLHQNDLAQSGGDGLGNGYVALVEGPLWVVTSGSGVADNGIVSRLAPHGGREVTTF